MISTAVGRFGRVYVEGKVFQRCREYPNIRVSKATSDNDLFIIKRLFRPLYDTAERVESEFAGSQRLRVHVDRNQEESFLVDPYFRTTLLELIKDYPDLDPNEREKILRGVGEAIQELHAKDWVHRDVKPDNILANWTCDEQGNQKVTDVALGDLDIARKLEGGEPRGKPTVVGNVMWRSPEGQTGNGTTKASDVFAFGLVCLYTLGAGDLLILNGFQELQELRDPGKGVLTPEQEVVTRHFCYFGPANEGLLSAVSTDAWRQAFTKVSAYAEGVIRERPQLRFEHWGAELGPDALHLISGMTCLDPAARPTIDQILAHPGWREVN